MGQSIISKPPRSRKLVATKTGATNINDGVISIELPKVRLVSEWILDILLSQTWGTNPPSSSDVRRSFSKVELVSDTLGTLISCDFHQAYDSARYYENTPVPVVDYGAGSGAAATARYQYDLHAIMDGATLDLLTALQTSEHGSLTLELTLASKANSLFIGGTGTAGEVTATINVKEFGYVALTGKNVRSGNFIYGRAHHEQKALEQETGAAAAASDHQVKLLGGKKLRKLIIHTFDTTTPAIPVLANGILDKITSLEIGGVEYCFNISAESFQQENISDRNFNQAGVYVVDFLGDPAGWPLIAKGEEVIMKYTKRAGSPAGWKVAVLQDSAVNLNQAIAA